MQRSSASRNRLQTLLLLLLGGPLLSIPPGAAAQDTRAAAAKAGVPAAHFRRFSAHFTTATLCGDTGAVIGLAWTPADGVTSYEIVRDGTPIATVGADHGSSFTCEGLAPGTHSFVVRAHTGAGSSDAPAVSIFIQEAFCTAGMPPQAPALSVGGPFCDSVSSISGAKATGIQLTWTAAPNAAGYDVLRDGQPVRSGYKLLALRDYDGLRDGKTYVYVVRARNAKGAADSRAVTVVVPNPFCGAQ